MNDEDRDVRDDFCDEGDELHLEEVFMNFSKEM